MRKSNYPKVSIITVNFNGKKYLKKLLDSLFCLNYPKNRLEIIMVDNASGDNSIKFVERNYRKVKIIKNTINNYCQAVNLGIEASKSKYIALANNDTWMDKNWLIELMKVITRDKMIAAASGKILDRFGKIQNAAHYELPNFYWGERGAGQERSRFNTLEEVPSLCGVAIVYKKDALLEVGLFDEDFIIYGEDVDISLRLKQKGYKLMFVPRSIIYHHFHGTATEEFARYYIERNRLLFLAKHYPHKLSDSLIGSGYFTAKKSIDACGKIYAIFPEIIMKLTRTHPLNIAGEVVAELFGEINKIANYENDLLAREINKITEDRNNTYLRLTKAIKDIEGECNLKLKIISDKEKEIGYFKGELERIRGELYSRMDEILVKSGQLIEMDTRVNGLNSQITQLNEQVKDQLNSLEQKDDQLKLRRKELTSLRGELNSTTQQLRRAIRE